MVPEALQSKVRQVVDDSVAKLQPYFPDEVFPPISIQYKPSGVTAGYAHTQDYLINFNPILLIANEEEFLRQIVPHEVAHVITDHIHGYETKPHGKEWQSVMILLGLPPEPFHDLDVTLAKRSITTYTFSCECENGTYIHEYGSCLRRKILIEKLGCADCLAPLVPFEPVHQPKGMPWKVAVGTKQDRAKWVIKKNKTLCRKDLIEKLMTDAGLTKAGAATYVYNLRRTVE